jgi:holo-[acyl-carrier protein] synthase
LIIGIGLDVVPIARMEAMLARHGVRAEERIFTAGERADVAGRAQPAQHFAARFAAKEAVLKALSAPSGLRWVEMEVRSAGDGRPVLLLSGAAAAAAASRGVNAYHLSLTHAGGIAAAVVVLEGREL